jgi:hypothetical protein
MNATPLQQGFVGIGRDMRSYTFTKGAARRDCAVSQPTNLDFEAMRAVDIRTVDPATLVDIQNTKINMQRPVIEKALDYLNQIKNAYCFRCGDTIVKISHSKTTTTLNDSMESFFRSF